MAIGVSLKTANGRALSAATVGIPVGLTDAGFAAAGGEAVIRLTKVGDRVWDTMCLLDGCQDKSCIDRTSVICYFVHHV